MVRRAWPLCWKFDEHMKTPSLGLVLGFWAISERSGLSPGGGSTYPTGIFTSRVCCGMPELLSTWSLPWFRCCSCSRVRTEFLYNPVTLGLLVSCCLALSITAHEANLLREQLQFSLDTSASLPTWMLWKASGGRCWQRSPGPMSTYSATIARNGVSTYHTYTSLRTICFDSLVVSCRIRAGRRCFFRRLQRGSAC